MLYNIEKGKVQKIEDCFSCPYFNQKAKKCEGVNKACFVYDAKTQTIIDGVTKLPIKVKGE